MDAGHVTGDRFFTFEEASALLPEARQRIEYVAEISRQMVRIASAMRAGDQSAGLAEAKALDARAHEAMTWFEEHGVLVKGVAPAILDFPALRAGRVVLLCWREGEERISWWHELDGGYLGRNPIPEDQVWPHRFSA